MPVAVPRKSSPPPTFTRLKVPSTLIHNTDMRNTLHDDDHPLVIKATANGYSNGHTNGDVHPRANGYPNGAPKAHRRKSSQHRPTQINNTLHVQSPDGGEPPSAPNGPDVLVVKRIDWEIPRKALHSSIGFGVLYLYSRRPENIQPVVKSLAGALCVIVPADVLRLNYPPFEVLYEKALGLFMRESEKKSSNGVIWYIMGVIYVLALLPRDIAVVSVLILSWCDTAASTFGRRWGHLTPRLPRRSPVLGVPLAKKKSVAGFLGAAATGAVIAVAFWGWAVPHWQGYAVNSQWGEVAWKWGDGLGRGVGGGWLGLMTVGLVTGVVAGVAEALDLGNIDDNLSLPIISGSVLYGLSKLASYFLW